MIEYYETFCLDVYGADYLFLSQVTESTDNILVRMGRRIKELIKKVFRWIKDCFKKFMQLFRKNSKKCNDIRKEVEKRAGVITSEDEIVATRTIPQYREKGGENPFIRTQRANIAKYYSNQKTRYIEGDTIDPEFYSINLIYSPASIKDAIVIFKEIFYMYENAVGPSNFTLNEINQFKIDYGHECAEYLSRLKDIPKNTGDEYPFAELFEILINRNEYIDIMQEVYDKIEDLERMLSDRQNTFELYEELPEYRADELKETMSIMEITLTFLQKAQYFINDVNTSIIQIEDVLEKTINKEAFDYKFGK